MITNILLSITLLGVAALAWKLFSASASPQDDDRLQRKNEEIGELKNQLEKGKQDLSEMTGKNKQLFAELTNAKADTKAISNERDLLQKRVNTFEAESSQRTKQHEVMVEKLSQAEKNFEAEKARVIREDEERRASELAERDRLWAEHENRVISDLTDLCSQKQFAFPTFDNTNLPEGFHGKLKPDFMIGFLKQYVIFDVKVSEAKNLQTYINDQVKKTAAKVKGNESIYSSIFLVVPTVAIKELKKTSFYEEEFNFFIVSPESIPPILALFKKIEKYEFAEDMNPQERENIVDLIAAFDHHISTRNAHEFSLMAHGLQTLEKAKKLDANLLTDAIAKKAKIRHLNMNTAEIKELVAKPEQVAEELLELVKPKPKISSE